MSRTLYSYISVFIVLTLLNVHSVLSLSNTLLNVQHSELSLSNNKDPSIVNCANFTSCGECTSHLQCGFCVTTNQCVQGGWKGPLKDSSICPSWEYQYAQCFVSTKQAIISLASALFGIIFISFLLCLCCCLCQCCKLRNNDEERVALLGDSLATHHFRRASYYNYNRNRPFERRGRTISTGTANSLMQYGRNWRATDDYMYGYGGPTTQSMLWVNDNSGVPTDYSIGSNNNSGEWRRWEKKREELLAKYAKSSNEA